MKQIKLVHLHEMDEDELFLTRDFLCNQIRNSGIPESMLSFIKHDIKEADYWDCEDYYYNSHVEDIDIWDEMSLTEKRDILYKLSMWNEVLQEPSLRYPSPVLRIETDTVSGTVYKTLD